MDKKQEALYVPKRVDLIYDIFAHIYKFLLESYFSVRYEHTERLNGLRNEGFLLLPKHQRLLDIPLEGAFLKETNKKGYFVMKSSLPGLLDYMGGIGISRLKDLGKLNREELSREELREELRKAVKEAQIQKRFVYSAIEYLLGEGEIVVVHPEGTRNYKSVGYPNEDVLTKLLAVQRRMGRLVPFVPLDISYESKFLPFSRVVVTVGQPIQTEDLGTLVRHLCDEVELLEPQPQKVLQ